MSKRTKWNQIGSNSDGDFIEKKEQKARVREMFYDTLRIHRMKPGKIKKNLTSTEDNEE